MQEDGRAESEREKKKSLESIQHRRPALPRELHPRVHIYISYSCHIILCTRRSVFYTPSAGAYSKLVRLNITGDNYLHETCTSVGSVATGPDNNNNNNTNIILAVNVFQLRCTSAGSIYISCLV